MLNVDVNPLKKLRHLDLNTDFEDSEKTSFGENIETLLLHDCKANENVFVTREYTKLKSLTLMSSITEPTRKWKLFEHVKELMIDRFSSREICTSIFRFNDFRFLEKLVISSYGFTSCKRLLPKLRHFRLKCSMDDEYFKREGNLPSLKKLELMECGNISGNGWGQKNIENLEELRIVQCDKFTDHFFSSLRFDNLKRLEFEGSLTNYGIRGKNWNPLPKLEELRIYETPFLCNELFESGKVVGLRVVEISKFREKNVQKCLATRGRGVQVEEPTKVLLGTKSWKVPNLEVLDGTEELFDPQFLDNLNNEFLQESCQIRVERKATNPSNVGNNSTGTFDFSWNNTNNNNDDSSFSIDFGSTSGDNENTDVFNFGGSSNIPNSGDFVSGGYTSSSSSSKNVGSGTSGSGSGGNMMEDFDF